MPATQLAVDPALVQRIEAEYREMPGLCLTIPQACRLWALDIDTCELVLAALIAAGELRHTRDGSIIRAA